MGCASNTSEINFFHHVLWALLNQSRLTSSWSTSNSFPYDSLITLKKKKIAWLYFDWYMLCRLPFFWEKKKTWSFCVIIGIHIMHVHSFLSWVSQWSENSWTSGGIKLVDFWIDVSHKRKWWVSCIYLVTHVSMVLVWSPYYNLVRSR